MKRITTINIFFLSIISSLCLYSSLTHGMESRPRDFRPFKTPTLAEFTNRRMMPFSVSVIYTKNGIIRHAEKVKNRTPRRQLISWVKLWQKYRSKMLSVAGPEIFQHIELLLCKYPSLSFASAGITKEQFAPTEEGRTDLLENVCEVEAPLLVQQLIDSGIRCDEAVALMAPLSEAAFHGNTHVTAILLKAGAQPYTGLSGPIDTASIDNKPELLRMLLYNIVQRKNHQPLTIELPYTADNRLEITTKTMAKARKQNNPTIVQLLDCATTQPQKLAKLGYPLELLPAQLPHILMMRERGVKYTGDRLHKVATMRANNLRQTGDRMGQVKRKRDDQKKESRKKIA